LGGEGEKVLLPWKMRQRRKEKNLHPDLRSSKRGGEVILLHAKKKKTPIARNGKKGPFPQRKEDAGAAIKSQG